MKIKTAILILIVSSIMAGCSDSSNKQETTKKVASAVQSTTAAGDFDSLPDDAVLISVNGKSLTKAEFQKWIDLRLSMVKMSQGQKVDSELQSLVKEQMLESVTNDYISQVVSADYAKSVGIAASTSQVARCRQGFSYACRMPNTKWDKVLKRFPSALCDTIENRVASEALLATVFNNFVEKNKITVEQAEIDKLYKSYLDYNKVCAATNSQTWAKASNIWQRVVSGEDFKELAIQFDEDEYRESDGVWGTFQVSNFVDEPEIWKLSSKFRPGWVSPPIEADNGLMIMMVDSIEDDKGDVNAPGYVPSPSASVTISRIFLRLPLFVENMDKEQFAQQAIQTKKSVEFKKFLDGYVSKADIKFPNGTAVFSPSQSAQQSNGVAPNGMGIVPNGM